MVLRGRASDSPLVREELRTDLRGSGDSGRGSVPEMAWLQRFEMSEDETGLHRLDENLARLECVR